MSEILLINRDDIMRMTSLRGTIDLDKLLPHIKTSQDFHLQPRIGTALLAKCKQLVADDQLNDEANAAYKTLIEDYIAPTLVFLCMEEVVPFLAYEISNGGIFKHTPENTTPLDKAELDSLVARFRDRATFYGSRLDDYLIANSNSFPEFTVTNNGELPASGTPSFSGGWVL